MISRELVKKGFTVFTVAVMCAAAGLVNISESSIEVKTGNSVVVNAADNTDYLVKTSVKLLSQNEGTYTSVNKNDCGAVSIGILQWHGTRALNLLKSVVKANSTQAKKLLGDTLYKEVTEKKDWSKRTVNSNESKAISSLLGTKEAKSIEDELAYNDVKQYVTRAKNLGLFENSVIVYYADLYNFGPVCADRVAKNAASAAGSYKKVTLDQIHSYALKDSSSGQYAPRRKKAYDFCRKLEDKSVVTTTVSTTKAPVKSPFNGIYFRACDSKYGSIVDALNSIGAKSSFTYRKEISAVNNIQNYTGTSQENITMLNLLKAGRLLAPEKAPVVTTSKITTPVVKITVTKPVTKVTETVTEAAESVTKVTEIVTEAAEPVIKVTEVITEAAEPVTKVTEFVTEITEPVTTALTTTEVIASVSTEAEVPETSKGDINMDGKVDITDMSMLSSYLVGDISLTDEQKAAADVDEDGSVFLTDLAKFKQFLSHFITEL